MQKQIKQLDYRDSILCATDDAVNSIDITIANLHDSETSQVLQKYGFNIYHLLDDLNACKEDVTQFGNSQQRCVNAFEKYTEIKRSLDVMPDFEEIKKLIGLCINNGNCDLLNDLVYKIKLTHNIDKQKVFTQKLKSYKRSALVKLNSVQATEEEKLNARRSIEDCCDFVIRRLSN